MKLCILMHNQETFISEKSNEVASEHKTTEAAARGCRLEQSRARVVVVAAAAGKRET